MSEIVENVCPVLYLGKLEQGKLCGGWSEYLPEELNLYFGRIIPISDVHLFLSAEGQLYCYKSMELCTLEGWKKLLGPSQGERFLACFDSSKGIIEQLERYFGVNF